MENVGQSHFLLFFFFMPYLLVEHEARSRTAHKTKTVLLLVIRFNFYFCIITFLVVLIPSPVTFIK